MEELRRLFKCIEANIKHELDGDRNIYIVLNPRSEKKNLFECGHIFIEVVDAVRKSANIRKRDNYPNLVLVQSIRDVPERANNIVYWNEKVFGEKIPIRLQQVLRLISDSSEVLSPFMWRDGLLVNNYGPVQQTLVSDPYKHESNHSSFRTSLYKVIECDSKIFSVYQTFIRGIFHSQHCDQCLFYLLNSVKSSSNVQKFVHNLCRGVWSPKSEKGMEQCFDWKQDDEESYKPHCWRLSKESFNKNSVGSVSPSSLSSQNATSDFYHNDNWLKKEDEMCEENVISYYYGRETSKERHRVSVRESVDRDLLESDERESCLNANNTTDRMSYCLSVSPETNGRGCGTTSKKNPTKYTCEEMRTSYSAVGHSMVANVRTPESTVATKIDFWNQKCDKEDADKEKQEGVRQLEPRASSAKRRTSPISDTFSPQKKRAVDARKVKTVEYRRNARISNAVAAKFQVSDPLENVADQFPNNKASWTRNQHRMAALGHTYSELQNFQPKFLQNTSGNFIRFEADIDEEHDKESTESEISSEELEFSDHSSSDHEIVSDAEQPKTIDDSLEDIEQPPASELSIDISEYSVIEIEETSCNASIPVPNIVIEERVEKENAIEADSMINAERERKIITIDDDEDVIILDQIDEDVIWLE